MRKGLGRGGLRPHERGHSSGFSLVEVVVALVILEVGLLACAGMILSAQRSLARARVLQRAVLETSRSADSLTAMGWTTAGARAFPGGVVEWVPEEAEDDCIRIFSIGALSADTLFQLRTWSLARTRPPSAHGHSVQGTG